VGARDLVHLPRRERAAEPLVQVLERGADRRLNTARGGGRPNDHGPPVGRGALPCNEPGPLEPAEESCERGAVEIQGSAEVAWGAAIQAENLQKDKALIEAEAVRAQQVVGVPGDPPADAIEVVEEQWLASQ
jgi:hypothetical protein